MSCGTFLRFVALTALTASAQTVPVEDYATWSRHRLFSFNTMSSANGGLGVLANVTGYPLLIRLNASNAADVFAEARPGGADLRFRRTTTPPIIVVKVAASANAAASAALAGPGLPYEIEHWDSAGQTAAIWVLVDTVFGNRANQAIAMYWGKPGAASLSNPANVFDSAAGYVGVWHLGGASPTAPRPNAVPGGNAAIPSGTSVATGFPARAGLIGRGDTLRGGTDGAMRASDDHLDLGAGYGALGSTMMMSLWLKPATPPTTAWNVYVGIGNGAPGDNLTIGRMGGTRNLFSEAFNGTTGGGRSEMLNVLNYDQWQYVVFAAKGAEQLLYLNGTSAIVSRATAITVPGVPRTMAYLGRSLWASDPNSAAAFDELRLHRVARSQEWLQLDYYTQRSQGSALGVTSPPATPTPSSPAANATDVSVFASLVVQSFEFASYRFQLATDSLFTAPVKDTTISATTLPVGTLAFTTAYYWRVRAMSDAGQSQWSAARRFTTGAIPLETGIPTLISPAAFATGVGTPAAFSWSAASGATSYHLQVSTVPTFATRVVEDSSIAALARSGGPLAANTEHYWRVRGKGPAGTGAWSEIRAFTTYIQAPGIPALLLPAGFATDVAAGSPTLSWSPVQGAVSYRVQVSLTPDFATFVNNDTTTATSRTLGTLAGYTNYYWRVNAKNVAGTSAYSSPRQFTTGEPVSLRDHARLALRPLRTQGGTQVLFTLSQSDRVTVSLRDPRGKMGGLVLDRMLPEGVHVLDLPVSSGVRVLEFRAGSATRTLLLQPD